MHFVIRAFEYINYCAFNDDVYLFVRVRVLSELHGRRGGLSIVTRQSKMSFITRHKQEEIIHEPTEALLCTAFLRTPCASMVSSILTKFSCEVNGMVFRAIN
jgi:hypothetical protein